MKRFCSLLNYLLLLTFLVYPENLKAQSTGYLTPDQVSQRIRQMENTYPGVVSARILTNTPGDRPLQLIRIGRDPEAAPGTSPSVFIGANLEGNRPLATEGAIFLAETILSDPAHFDSLNW
jgi:hypothetical protein